MTKRKHSDNRMRPAAAPASPGKKASPFQIFIPSILCVILIAALVPRIDAVKRPHPYSFDEGLYDYLGTQMKYQPFNYSSSGYYKLMAPHIRPDAERERVRQYVDVRLFKHPPLFPMMICIAKTLFGDSRLVANYVSLFCGIGLIVVVYLIARELWGGGWALLAALFMAVEPVSWHNAQKVWIEVPLAFCIYLGLLFLLWGGRKKVFLVLSGAAFGAALLCKYAGILAVIPVYGVLLFSNVITDRKMLALYIALPFLVGIPWLLWNYSVFGNGLFVELIRMNATGTVGDAFFRYILKFVLMAAIPAAILLGLVVAKCAFVEKADRALARAGDLMAKAPVRNMLFGLAVLAVGILSALSFKSIIRAFLPGAFLTPMNVMDPFRGSPHYFYFYHLIEVSPLFLVGYCAVTFFRRWNVWIWMLALMAVSTLAFLGFFGGYEVRYVIGALPALMLLAAYTTKESVTACMRQAGWRRQVPLFLIVTIVAYAVLKTVAFDLFVIAKNTFFFF